MDTFLKVWRLGLRGLGHVEQVAVALLLVNIVVSIAAQVVSRYLFGKPIVWVEEVAVYSFIWATFLGAGLAMKYDRHLRINTFIDRLGRYGAPLMRALGALFVVVLLASLMPTLMAAIGVEMRRRTIALPVQLPVAWFYSVPLLVGMVSIAVTAAYHVGVEIHRLFGGAPPPPIMTLPDAGEEELEAELERTLAGRSTRATADDPPPGAAPESGR